MKKHLCILMLALLALNVNQEKVQAQTTLEKNFSGIERLEIQGGSLEVSYTGSDRTDIDLTAYLGDEEGNENDLVFITMDNTLKIAYKRQNRKSDWNNRSPKRYIRISGPENIELGISNSSGKVIVDNVQAEKTRLSTSSGLIQASGIGGDLVLKGSSGKIEAKDIAGDVTCAISSGAVDIEQVSGDLDYSSTSGRLKASQIGGKVDAKLTSGNVSLNNIGELGALSVSSGSIRAENAGLGNGTSFNGSSGSFNVNTPSDLSAFNFDLSANSGGLTVGRTSTAKKLQIHNGSSATVRGKISSGSIKIGN